jgi:septal ring factor EnvC (AmiA/AmiB activator)
MTKNNNVNKNSNIVYLDFSDYDIKKKTKKKKVKKKVNNKKKSVDKLKETLSQFDTLLNEAKENNIEIPKELGELPVNIEDVNSIKELNELKRYNRKTRTRIWNYTNY